MPGEKSDRGYALLEADGGGYVVVGETGSYHTNETPTTLFGNIFLMKTDIYGDTIWTKTYGNDDHDVAYSLEKTSDGGYIIAGCDGYSGIRGDDYGLWIIKTDGLGDSIWTKKYKLAEGKSICKTTDGGYIVTGASWWDSLGSFDVYLLKIDSLGNKQWLKNYNKSSENEGLSVEQTNDNGFIISAMTNYETSRDIWLIKTDSVGDTIWTKIYTSEYSTIGYSVCQTTDGGYFIAGKNTELGGGLESNIYLLKTDSIGDTIWTKTIRKSYSDIAYSGMQTADGGYIAVGYTKSKNNDTYNSNIYLVKLDYEGNILWSSEIGNKYNYDFRGRDITETNDSGFIITGQESTENYHYVDLCLVKVNSEGVLTSVEDRLNKILPKEYSLHQNFPNPFNPSTSISYQIPKDGFVNLVVYNILGQVVSTLVNEHQTIGKYSVRFNESNLPSGVYIYKLHAGEFSSVKKMLLTK